MAVVGVLALQGSFNEHIAGMFHVPYSTYLHCFFFHSSFFTLLFHSLTYIIKVTIYYFFWCCFLCVVVALRRVGVKGVEIRKPEQLQTVSSLIIPGGESTTMAKLAEYHNLVSSSTLFLFLTLSLSIHVFCFVCIYYYYYLE